MDLKDLKKLIRACKKLGVTYIKNNEIELHLDGDAQAVTKKRKKKLVQDELVDESKERKPTESEMLFWSANAMDGYLNENHPEDG